MSDPPVRPRPAYGARVDGPSGCRGAVTLEDLSPSGRGAARPGKGVRVAVVDSGIEADHPTSRAASTSTTASRSTVDDDGEPIDDARPPRRRLRPRHRLRRHHPLPRPRGPDHQRPGARRRPAGKAAGFLPGPRRGRSSRASTSSTCRSAPPHGTGPSPSTRSATRPTSRHASSSPRPTTSPRPSFPSLYASVTSVACNLGQRPVPVPLQPRAPHRVPGPGHRRRGAPGTAARRSRPPATPTPPPTSRPRRPHPVQAPRAAALPGQDGAVGDRRQRPGGGPGGAGAPPEMAGRLSRRPAPADELGPGHVRPVGAGRSPQAGGHPEVVTRPAGGQCSMSVRAASSMASTPMVRAASRPTS